MLRSSPPVWSSLLPATLLGGLLLLPALTARAGLSLQEIPPDFIFGQPSLGTRPVGSHARTDRTTVPPAKLAAVQAATLFPLEASDAFAHGADSGRNHGFPPENRPGTETSLDRLAHGPFAHFVDEEDVRLDSPFDRVGEVTVIGADTETLVYVPDKLPLPAFLAPLVVGVWIRRRTRRIPGSLSR